jgi:hypothetical protein
MLEMYLFALTLCQHTAIYMQRLMLYDWMWKLAKLAFKRSDMVANGGPQSYYTRAIVIQMNCGIKRSNSNLVSRPVEQI